jgi:hypothetical protein
MRAIWKLEIGLTEKKITNKQITWLSQVVPVLILFNDFKEEKLR